MSLQIYSHVKFAIVFPNEAETHSTGLGGFNNKGAMMWGKRQKEPLCKITIFAILERRNLKTMGAQTFVHSRAVQNRTLLT